MIITELHKDIYNGKICPYCKSNVKVVSEEFIYGRFYKHKSMICCVNYPKCNSYVGTHKDGTALGRLANPQLRRLKKLAHDSFDKIWKNKYLERGEAYKHLSENLGIPQEFTHMGMFNEDTCKEVIYWSNDCLKHIEKLD